MLHHSRQLLSPSAYLTLLGRLLTLPPSPAAALPHAAAVGATVGRALCQLQQRPGSVLPLLAPLLVRLLRGGGVGEQDDGEGGPATNAPQRLAALVVIARVAAGGGEEEKQQQQRAEGGVAAASASVSLPPALIGPLVALALGGGSEAADEEEEEEEENEALAKASRPLLLALLRRHGPELLPPLVERATPFLLSSPPLSASSGASHSFQEWLREGGVNWAPAREGLAGLRAQCLGRLPQLQGVVHDLDLLPLGLGK